MRSSKPTAKALPKRLSIGIGGHFGPSYSVTLEKGGRLIYTYWSGERSSSREPEFLDVRVPELQREEIQPTKEEWQAFRRALDELNVWGWQAHYLDAGVCDGTGWSVEIVAVRHRINHPYEHPLSKSPRKPTQTATTRQACQAS